ncbi:22533_t:CDS:2, partial [Racocetra persica]
FDETLSDSSPKSSYGSDQIYYESDANEFEKYTFTQFKNMKVTDSLRLKEDIIINSILNKFKLRRYTNTKKRKIEFVVSSSSPDIVSENIEHIEEGALEI